MIKVFVHKAYKRISWLIQDDLTFGLYQLEFSKVAGRFWMSLTSTQQLFAVRLWLEMQKSLRICRLLILMFMSEYFLGVYCLGQLKIHTREKDESWHLRKGDTRVHEVTISNTTKKTKIKLWNVLKVVLVLTKIAAISIFIKGHYSIDRLTETLPREFHWKLNTLWRIVCDHESD